MRTFHRGTQAAVATLLSLGLLIMMVGIASAHSTYPTHAKVLKAIPAIGSTIAQPPTTITVFTAENINPDPKLSNLFVYGPSGDLISQGNAKVSLNDPKQMSIAIKPEKDGIYIVRWITVSALDGDPDQGGFVFTVNSTVAATPTAATHAATPTPAASTTSSTSSTPLIATIVGVVTLLIGLGIGVGIGRNTARSSLSSMRKTVAAQQTQEEASTKRNP
jgi:methionine-rich copper-binding protein CopC